MAPKETAQHAPFNAQTFLNSLGITKTIVKYPRGAPIFRQGDACENVLYLQEGGVKLWVASKSGKEAVVAMISGGDFFGEECLVGQTVRMGSATTLMPSVIVGVGKERMIDLLHHEHALADRFIAHVLSRHIQIEEALIDQFFNSSEKRLARLLVQLDRYAKQDASGRPVPIVSQGTLAGMVGTTRSRVNFFLQKFKKLGFIEYDDGRRLKINASLLSVVLRD